MILTTKSEGEFIIKFRQPSVLQHILFSYSIIANDESESFLGQSLDQWGNYFNLYNCNRFNLWNYCKFELNGN